MVTSDGLMPVEKAASLHTPYVDYTKFEGLDSLRSAQKQTFLEGSSYLPDYDYPRLNTLQDLDEEEDDRTPAELKSELIEAVYSLEAGKASGAISQEKAELVAQFHEFRLRKIMMVEAAQGMRSNGTGESQRTARETFMSMNREIYGDMDDSAWHGIMNTELQRIIEFKPTNETAAVIINDLAGFLRNVKPGHRETELIDAELVAEYLPLIEEKYAHIFAVIPDTDEMVKYGAHECAQIMNKALQTGGFPDSWQAEVRASKVGVATNTKKQRIFLPEKTNRTADELKRLILHEQEVHARRGLNGESHPSLPLLSRGTANYADVEEGLGVFLEMIMAGSTDNPAVTRARDRYITAGLALGVDDSPRDGRQTFEAMWRLLAVRNAKQGTITAEDIARAKSSAYDHVENAFRGTNFAGRGIVYTKLKVYYEGLIKNVAYAKEIAGSPERFEEIFIGKYDHTDTDERNLIMDIIAKEENNGRQ